ncbi:MAG: Sugar phosphate isomerase/epimerase [Candidatus Methanohalarchaeum thermophilum]|uniref:Sugar phosphate isomerase/epimerase n=1 Tax=Methanohalarchaeum thermophilum TaxID=1903181 RepID=A0A1Q6DU44_METT1|nr:MAG: Sugar phosphate isomerase/epimerase [Candidatus Methanohalarchaeum thermophilum]
MTLGVGLAIYYSKKYDLYEKIKHIGESDIQQVELYCGSPFLKKWNTSDYIEEIKKIKEELNTQDLNSSVHSPHYDLNISTWNSGVRKVVLEEIKKTFKAANLIGSNLVVVHPGYVPSRKFSREKALQKMIDNLRELVDVAENFDIMIGLENLSRHSKALGVLPRELNMVLDEVDSKNLGITFDVAHANTISSMSPVEYIQEIGDRIIHVHLSDNRGEDEHLPIGVGDIDFRDVLAELKKFDYSGDYIIEGWLPRQDYKDFFVKKSYKIIKNHLKNI